MAALDLLQGAWVDYFLALLFVLLACIVLLVAILAVQTLTGGGCPSCDNDGGGSSAPAHQLSTFVLWPTVAALVSSGAYTGFDALLRDGIPTWIDAYLTRSRDRYVVAGQPSPLHDAGSSARSTVAACSAAVERATGVPPQRVAGALAALAFGVLPYRATFALGALGLACNGVYSVLIRLLHPHLIAIDPVAPAVSAGSNDRYWQYRLRISHHPSAVEAGELERVDTIQRRFKDFVWLHEQVGPLAERYGIVQARELPTANWMTGSDLATPADRAAAVEFIGSSLLKFGKWVTGNSTRRAAEPEPEPEPVDEEDAAAVVGSHASEKRALRLQQWFRAVLVDGRLNGQLAVQLFLDNEVGCGGCRTAHEHRNRLARPLDPEHQQSEGQPPSQDDDASSGRGGSLAAVQDRLDVLEVVVLRSAALLANAGSSRGGGGGGGDAAVLEEVAEVRVMVQQRMEGMLATLSHRLSSASQAHAEGRGDSGGSGGGVRTGPASQHAARDSEEPARSNVGADGGGGGGGSSDRDRDSRELFGSMADHHDEQRVTLLTSQAAETIGGGLGGIVVFDDYNPDDRGNDPAETETETETTTTTTATATTATVAAMATATRAVAASEPVSAPAALPAVPAATVQLEEAVPPSRSVRQQQQEISPALPPASPKQPHLQSPQPLQLQIKPQPPQMKPVVRMQPTRFDWELNLNQRAIQFLTLTNPALPSTAVGGGGAAGGGAASSLEQLGKVLIFKIK